MRRILLAMVVSAFAVSFCRAEFVRVEAAKVPVERIAKNLEQIIKNDPKNAVALQNLARAHAMAYSLRSEEVPAHPTIENAIWFGHEPEVVPFNRVKKTDDKEKLAAAQVHLEKSIQHYDELLKLTPDDVRAQLGYGWLLAQANKKTEAVAALRKSIDKAWETEQKLTRLGFGGTITAEGVGYLVPLLDPEKDKNEIAVLKERAAKMDKLPRLITPIAVPLKAGLAARDVEDRRASVAFDADGSGIARKWTWVNKDAAWLVHDPKNTGKVTSALQLFGNVTFWMFWETGYGPLAALDDNHDGRLSGAELRDLSLWNDRNGDGVCDAGEVRPVAEYGIVAISCVFTRDASHPDRIAYSPAGVTYRDGTTRPTFDIVLHPAN